MTFPATRYPDPKPTDWTYWLMMQIAMVVGFLTTYPANWWLIRRGIKEKM
jgi:ABC-type multidrug transport system permease subunit